MLALSLTLVLFARLPADARLQPAATRPQDPIRPETSALSAAEAIERAGEHLTQAREARGRAEYGAARTRAALGHELLLAIPMGTLDVAGCDLLRGFAELHIELGPLRSAGDALERTVAELAARIPDEDRELCAARLELAFARFANANYAGSAELAERVLEVYERTSPEADPDRLRARSLLAMAIGASGRWAESRDLLIALADLRSSARPEDRVGLAVERVNLALAHFYLGEFPAARQLAEQALETLEREVSRDHRELVRARRTLAPTLDRLGEHRAARLLAEQVLDSYLRVLDEDDIRVRSALSNLAKAHDTFGEHAAARDLYARALAIAVRTLPPEDVGVLSERANLAAILTRLGELEAARDSFEIVLEVAARTLPEAHPIAMRTRRGLALALRDLGELAAAREVAERSLAIAARSTPTDEVEAVLARESLANVLMRMGDVAAARSLFEQVLEAKERAVPPDPIGVPLARMNLAVTLEAMGDLAGARTLLERALAEFGRVLPEDHQYVHLTRLNLGVVLTSIGDPSSAGAHYEAILASRERVLPPDHPDLIHARAYLAGCRAASGDVEAALDLNARVLDALARARPDTDLLLMMRRVAQVQFHVRLAAGSEAYAAECAPAVADLLIAALRGARASVWTTLFDASPREVEERVAVLGEYMKFALSGALGLGVLPPDEVALREAFLYFESSRASGLTAARLAARLEGDEVARELRARLGSATQVLAERAASGVGRAELDAAHADLDRAGRALVQHAGRALGAEVLLEPTIEALAAALGPGDALVSWRRVSLQSVERGSGAVEPEVRSYVAFVVRPGDPRPGAEPEPRAPRFSCVVLGPAEPIEQAAESWRATWNAPSDSRGLPVVPGTAPARDDPSAPIRFRELVLDPLRGRLVGVERLIVALDDVLHTVPLEAMPAGDPWAADQGAPSGDGALLGDVLRIEVRPTLLELLLPQSPRLGAQRLVALGGADFDHDRTAPEPPSGSGDERADPRERLPESAGVLRGGAWEAGFVALPGTLAEARGVASIFHDVFGGDGAELVLEGRDASIEALRDGAHDIRWLHLATHGWFAPESVRSSADVAPDAASEVAWMRQGVDDRVRSMSPMLLCGLALAGANLPPGPGGRIPGLVTAQELATLDLSNCELAVLSACDTNVGIRRVGQGVASLQRALHMAGARSVVTSLWKVPDEATKELMIDFYRRVWVEKKPKHLALWEAKTRLREAKDERGAPRHSTRDWAAWVLTGVPD